MTPVTSASANKLVGIAMADVTIAEAIAGKRVEVYLLQAGTMVPMIVGAAVTFGSEVICQGTTGRVSDAAATPDARTIIGRAYGSSAVAGDLVPVLVGALAVHRRLRASDHTPHKHRSLGPRGHRAGRALSAAWRAPWPCPMCSS